MYTELYPHPLCPYVAADVSGSVWTRYTKGAGMRKNTITDTWRLLEHYTGPRFRPKSNVSLPMAAMEFLDPTGGKWCNKVGAGIFNLECFLGRTLKDHEVACHGPGGNCDHSKSNLSVNCQLNNIIDSVIDGSILTTPESIALAINRLEAYYREITN